MEKQQLLNRLLSLAGLCRRAGGVVPGGDSVISAVQRGTKPKAVILSSFATDRTKKQVTDKCTNANVPLYVVDIDLFELGEKLGLRSSLAVFALTGKGPVSQVVELAKKLNENNHVTDK